MGIVVRKRNLLVVTLSLAALVAGTTCSGHDSSAARATVEAPADLAALMPNGAVLYAQVESLDALSDAVERLGEAFAPDELSPNLDSMIGSMLPIDMAQVDRTRPFGVAVTLAAGQPQPTPTFMIPAKDTAALVAALPPIPGMAAPTISGGYVGLTMGRVYQTGAAQALTSGLPSALVSLRIDAATLANTLGPTIDAAFAQGARIFAAGGELSGGVPGMDMKALLDIYRDGIRQILASTKTLDLAIELEGSHFSGQAALVTRPGSPLAGLASKTEIDLREAAGRLPKQALASMLIGGNSRELMNRFASVMERFSKMYPEPMAKAMNESMAAYREVYALMGNSMAVDEDFNDGLQLTYSFESKSQSDAVKVVQKIAEILGQASMGALGIVIGEGHTVEIGGQDVTRLGMRFDSQKLPVAGGEAQKAQMERMMKLMLGGEKGLTVSLATSGRHGVMCVGGDDDHLLDALRRAKEPVGKPPAHLEWSLAQVGEATPSIVFSMDLGALVAGFAAMSTRMHQPIPGFREDFKASAVLAFFGVIDGDTLRMGMDFDLDEMAAFVSEVKHR